MLNGEFPIIPEWLHVLSVIALTTGFICAAVILFDVRKHPQHMGIMNGVWPVTALFGTFPITWMYWRYGKIAAGERMKEAKKRGEKLPGRTQTPFPIMVAKGTLHCGSGCCVGDICAEWLAFAFPTVAVWFGWQHLFSEKMFAVWIVDYIFAFILGIAFQYFTIAPMRKLSLGAGLRQAAKADILSLTAWQVGMYGFMALANFWLFRRVLGTNLEIDSPEFWFMMQIAMLCGFATAYPVNRWLLKTGVKEMM